MFSFINCDLYLNEQVAAMIGSVINYVRDSNNSISWDNYYYAELAINRLLEYGISKGYGTSYNSISRINTNASGFNKSKYNNLLKIANYTFQNYGKTNVTISSPSFDSTSGKAKEARCLPLPRIFRWNACIRK